MSNFKKLLWTLLTLLQASAVIGWYAFYRATRKFMGINRWIIYQNQKLEQRASGKLLCVIFCLLLLIFSASILRRLWQNKNGRRTVSGRYRIGLHLCNALLSAGLLLYALSHSTKDTRLYLFVLAFSALFLTAQWLKSLLYFGGRTEYKRQ